MSEVVSTQQHIHDLMNEMVDAVTYESLASGIVDHFARFYDADLCTLWRLVEQNERKELILSAGKGVQLKPGVAPQTYTLPDRKLPNAELEGVTIWIATRQFPCLANSYQELNNDPSKAWYGAHRGKWDQFQFTAEGEKFKNLLGLPILYNGKLIAVLKIESTRAAGGFTKADKSMAEQLTPFAAIALKSMEEREGHEQQRQSAIRNLTGALLHQDPVTFYQEVVDKTANLLNADICTLWLVGENNRKLKVSAAYGFERMQSPEYELNWDAKDDKEIKGLTPWVVIRKRSFYGERHKDLKEHPAWKGNWDKDVWQNKPEEKFGCLYAVPLLDVNRSPLGVLKIENREGKPKFNAVDRAIFDWVAEFVALALEFNSRLRSDIVYEFFHLLKQPVASAITAFDTLRMELEMTAPRQERIRSRLDMMAKNLETVRVWTVNVYGLATRRQAIGETPRETSLKQLLVKAVENMQNLFPDFDCAIKSKDDIFVLLTPLQIKQLDAVLFNLLDNAYKYSNLPRKIESTVERKDDFIHLTISDNGRGIAREDLARVFEPYFTRGMETWPSSLGLGLATVDRLLKEIRWDRKIESEPNRGTRFTIIIPDKEN